MQIFNCLLSRKDSSFIERPSPERLRCVNAVQFPMPSDFATKTDMCENGSEMVQAKYKVKCEKINDLTFGN